jgi:hypothetical protein
MALLTKPIPGRVFIMMVLLLFGGGVLTGMLTDHWQTSLTYADYQRLVPLASRLGH